MHQWLSALLIISVSLSLLASLFILSWQKLSKRYRPSSLYTVSLVFLLALILLPFRPALPQQTLLKKDVSLSFSQVSQVSPSSASHPLPLPAASQTALKTPAGAPATPKSKKVSSPVQPLSPKAEALPPSSFSSFFKQFSVWQGLFGLWVLGALGVLLYHGLSHYLFLKQIRRWKTPVTKADYLTFFSQIKSEMGISRPLSLALCPIIATPMLIGFSKPTILLPAAALTRQELGYILRHELTHYQRKDLWGKGLMLLAKALHWFNPLIHLYSQKMVLLSEVACDQQTLQGLSFEQRSQYCYTISHMAHHQKGLNTLFATPLLGGKKNMKTRVLSILDMNPKKISLALLALVVVLTLTAGLFLPFGYASGTGDETAFTNEQFKEIGLSSNALAAEVGVYLNDVFYAIARTGDLLAWKPGNKQLQQVTQLPVFFYTDLDYKLPQKQWAPQRQETYENAVSHLLPSLDGLWAYNDVLKKVGTIDETGVTWLDVSFTYPDPLEAPDYLSSAFVQNNTFYSLVDKDQVEYNQDYAVSTLLAFDLTTGQGKAFEVPNALVIQPYTENEALIVLEEEGKVAFAAFDLTSGQVSPLPNQVRCQVDEWGRPNLGGIAYNQATDTLYYIGDQTLYASTQGEEPIALRTMPREGNIFSRAWITQDGRYAFTLNDRLLLTDVTKPFPAPGEKGKLRLSFSALSSPTGFEEFILSHPGVEVIAQDTMMTYEEVVQALSTQDPTYDIFTLPVDSLFVDLLNKGYAYPLTESPALTQMVSNLYPFIQQGVTDQHGVPMALPETNRQASTQWSVNQDVWQEVFGDRPVPTTYSDLLDMFLEYVTQYQENYPKYHFFTTTYSGLVNQIIKDYLLTYGTKTAPLVVKEAPLLKETLEKAALLIPYIPKDHNDPAYADIADAEMENRPLLTNSSDLFFDEATLPYQRHYSFVPISSPVFEKDTPQQAALEDVYAWFINPHSANKALALEYLEFLAQDTAPHKDMILSPVNNKPIESHQYQSNVDSYTQYLAYLTDQLKEVTDPAHKLTLEEEVKTYTALVENAEAMRWQISPAGLAYYQNLAQNLTLYLDNPYITQNNAGATTKIKKLSEGYSKGELSLDGLLAELDNILYIEYMENQK